MKVTALLSVLLLSAACASNDGFVKDTVKTCQPGADLEIQAGIDAGTSTNERFDDQLEMLVEVSNNSHEDVTVKTVRVDPSQADSSRGMDVVGGSKEFNEDVPEAQSKMFEIPIPVRRRGVLGPQSPARVTAQWVDFAVTVVLSDGEAYRCSFRIAVPD